MAATTSITYDGVWGDVKSALVEVTFDSSYPTGGEAVDFATALDWYSITAVLPVSSSGGIIPVWDATNSLLMAFYQDGTTEFGQVSSTDDLSAETATCLVIGI